ncbi:hypothetical protein skT53_14460 [Effusibacillus dendaii]|uniref:Uncharacterized protein n=1 Tax=Effusibacillus dendaii TaxID=2743772 RepID=A0A7I8DEX4_9BACL|nr:hypothetical protein skT53_14460 [Effusibacillus dendaii]
MSFLGLACREALDTKDGSVPFAFHHLATVRKPARGAMRLTQLEYEHKQKQPWIAWLSIH